MNVKMLEIDKYFNQLEMFKKQITKQIDRELSVLCL